MAGVDILCFPLSKYTINSGCCKAYGGAHCPATSAVPANPAPPAPITPPSSANDVSLVFTQSAYGGAIPIIFGSDLISGNVIWASPFVKKTYTDGDQQKFYYTVNLAIAICEGVMDNLLKLYCSDQLALDNTMLTDASGNPIATSSGQVSTLTADLTSPTSPLVVLDPAARKTRITIFNGEASQTPPAIMQQQEGYDFTPAYRGTAFLLIENFLIADSIPSLTMEVSSNTVSLFPRQKFDPSLNTVLKFGYLQTSRGGFLSYMPGYDCTFFATRDTNTTGGSNIGLSVVNNNTMEIEKESVFVDPSTGLTFEISNPGTSTLLSSGSVLVDNSFANGDYRIWSPFFNYQTSSWRTNSSALGNHDIHGPGVPYRGSICAVPSVDDDGVVCDVVTIADWSGGNMAILAVYPDGGSIYPFFGSTTPFKLPTDGFYPWIGSCAITFTQAQANETPTFPDGKSTLGQHVYYFTSQAAVEGITVSRFKFDKQADGTLSLFTPRLDKSVAAIGFQDLMGSGGKCSISKVLLAPDNTFIIFADINGSQGSGLIFKWDPLGARIVWKTIFGLWSASSGGFSITPLGFGSNCGDDISNNKFAWISANGNEIWSVSLVDGTVKKEFLLADQSLPSGKSSTGVYIGKEDALIIEGTDGKLYKIYLSRANRAQAALSTIVQSLLKRVDWRIADTEIQGVDTLAVDGYTISSPGYTLRQSFSELQQVFTFDMVESNGEIVYKQRGQAPLTTYSETSLQASHTGQGTPWLSETHEYDIAGTRKIAVTYRDVDREYKSNVQSVQLPKYSNIDIDADAPIQVNVPIVLGADAARKLAEILLYAKITYQTGYDGVLPHSGITYDPSDVIAFKFNPVDNIDDVKMRIRQMSVGADWSIKITGAREDPDIYTDQINLFGTLGRYTPKGITLAPDRVDLTLLDIPYWSENQAISQDGTIAYPIYVTMTSLKSSAKLPTANITVTLDSGEVYDLPAISSFPTYGYVQGLMPSAPSCYCTQFNTSIVVFIEKTDGATLGSCSDYYDMLNNRNKNLAVVGDEIIQFQTATNLGNGQWQLSVLRRCLFGTEDGAENHKVGDKFILLAGSDGLYDIGSIRTVQTALGTGAQKGVKVSMPQSNNPNQEDTVELYTSKQFRPWRPCAGQINYSGTDAVISWKYRSRYSGQWPDDGSEAASVAFVDSSPLVAVTTYDVYLTKTAATFNPAAPSTYMRKVSLSNLLTFTYTTAMQTADGFNNLTDTLTAVVYQTVNKTGLDDSLPLLFSKGPRVL